MHKSSHNSAQSKRALSYKWNRRLYRFCPLEKTDRAITNRKYRTDFYRCNSYDFFYSANTPTHTSLLWYGRRIRLHVSSTSFSVVLRLKCVPVLSTVECNTPSTPRYWLKHQLFNEPCSLMEFVFMGSCWKNVYFILWWGWDGV